MSNGGTLDLSNGGTFTIAAANGSYSGVITGSGGLVKQGTSTYTLTNNNAYGGVTTVSAGTLKLGAANVIPDGSGKGNVSVSGTFDLNTFSETIKASTVDAGENDRRSADGVVVAAIDEVVADDARLPVPTACGGEQHDREQC